MAIELLPFDPAEYLNDDESRAEYLAISFENGDRREITRALGVVVRARGGVANLAQESGVEPETLNRILTDDCDPGLGVVLKVMHALGVKLSASRVA